MAKYILHFCLLLFAGCASLEKRLELFETTTYKYENAIRWGYYELANDFIKVDETDQKTLDFDNLQEIKVTSYELLKSRITENELQAYQTVEIKYYNTNDMIEKTLIDKQFWEFDRDHKRWFLKSGFPALK